MAGNIMGFFAAPPVDGLANNTIADVIGNKNDTYSTTTVTGILNEMLQHEHNQLRVWPSLTSPIALTALASAWASFGSTVSAEIIAANAITSAFDIHWAVIADISATGNYELKLYSGANGATEIAHVPFAKTSSQSQEGSIVIRTPILPANTRVSAAISSGNGVANTAAIKIIYQTMD